MSADGYMLWADFDVSPFVARPSKWADNVGQ